MFSIDGVELEITDDALGAVADKAIGLHTGARGLRSILEGVMLDIMYKIPSDPTIKKVIVNGDTVLNKYQPDVVRKEIA